MREEKAIQRREERRSGRKRGGGKSIEQREEEKCTGEERRVKGRGAEGRAGERRCLRCGPGLLARHLIRLRLVLDLQLRRGKQSREHLPTRNQITLKQVNLTGGLPEQPTRHLTLQDGIFIP